MKRVAVITGANRGLGRATAEALAKQKVEVILAGRKVAELEKIVAAFRVEGLKAHAFELDASKPELALQFAEKIQQDFAVDILVNNAGVFLDGRDGALDTALSVQLSTVEETLNVNTKTPLQLCKAFLPGMMERNFGRIVNVSSGMGQLSEMNGGYPAYRISKTALNAVTKIMAAEAAGKNVLVNSVCPGWVRTDMGGAQAERTIDKGIAGIVWAATLPDGSPTGGFFRDGKAIDW